MNEQQEAGMAADIADRETLIRLANSCDRAAARASTPPAMLSDLDGEDYRLIATLLRRFAA